MMPELEKLKAIAATPAVDWLEQLEHHVMAATEAMGKIHGGHWFMSVNHRTCHILITRQIDS